MRGGILLYAAQASPQIDTARAEKDRFRMEIRTICNGMQTAIPEHFPFVELGAFCIMPNHIHGIIIIILTVP